MEVKNIKANPEIILRDDLEEAAVLFNPENSKTFGLNRTGLVIWRNLDGKHSTSQIADEVTNQCAEIPEDLENHIKSFTDALVENGLAGYIL
ncbi:MAG: PqqD family peptide modification chaperone [Calditrichaeota bacterium]|nr:PqqD family peptide modification chaperone [Calditrichota bacterium]MBT7618085.1 PqqD family peptide modification chaperone [Calditrichota bacterium]MBT7789683.1 PqqD family peptide modification chaperone [Calditrichota bacterium]